MACCFIRLRIWLFSLSYIEHEVFHRPSRPWNWPVTKYHLSHFALYISFLSSTISEVSLCKIFYHSVFCHHIWTKKGARNHFKILCSRFRQLYVRDLFFGSYISSNEKVRNVYLSDISATIFMIFIFYGEYQKVKCVIYFSRNFTEKLSCQKSQRNMRNG